MPLTGRGLFFLVKEFKSKKQKLQINIKFISIKSRFKRQSNKKAKEEKTVLSKSDSFCENTSELQFAH